MMGIRPARAHLLGVLGAAGALTAAASAVSAAPCPTVPVAEIASRAGVFDASIVGGKIRAGTSDVAWTAGGCALLEKWVSAVSGDGTTLYLFHGQRGRLQ